MHRLEDGDEGDEFGLELAPLHSGAKDSEDVVIRVVEGEQWRAPFCGGRDVPRYMDAQDGFVQF